MRLIPSKYNIVYADIHSTKVFFNSATRIIAVPSSKENEIEINNILTAGEQDYDLDRNAHIGAMVNAGLLVESSKNEHEEVRKKFLKELYSTECLDITIIPTDNCNFDCVYCYQSENHHTLSLDNENRFYAFLRNKVRNCRQVRISWFGGEPLLCKHIILRMMKNIHSICQENGVPFFAQITSNGYNLDVDFFSSALRHHLLAYQITVDATKKVHNARRPLKTGQGTYDRIMENLLQIKERIESNSFRIVLRMNVDKKNAKDIKEFLTYYKVAFANDARFALYLEPVQDWGGDKMNDYEQNLFGRGMGYQWFDQVWEYALDLDIPMDNYLLNKMHGFICSAAMKNGYVFNYDGKLYKCPQAFYDDLCLEPNCIGMVDTDGNTILDDKKESLWLGDRYHAACEHCKYYPLCGATTCPYGVRFKNASPCAGMKSRNNILKYQIKEYIKQSKVIYI